MQDGWRFDISPERVWTAVRAVDDYPSWWPWLGGFSTQGLDRGHVTRCVVRSPLGFRLRLVLRVTDTGERFVAADVGGDLEGAGRLEVRPDGAGSLVSLVFDVRVARRTLRPFALLARPLFRWAHDRVLTQAVEAFRVHAPN